MKAQGKPIKASGSHTEIQPAPRGAASVVRGCLAKLQIGLISPVIYSTGDAVT